MKFVLKNEKINYGEKKTFFYRVKLFWKTNDEQR